MGNDNYFTLKLEKMYMGQDVIFKADTGIYIDGC